MGGKMDEMQGRAKQAAGDLTDNDELRSEGKVDEASGKTKQAVNDTIDKVKDTVKD